MEPQQAMMMLMAVTVIAGVAGGQCVTGLVYMEQYTDADDYNGDADGSASVDSDGDTAECLMSKMTTAMAMMLMAVAVMKMAELAMMMLCSPLNLVKK